MLFIYAQGYTNCKNVLIDFVDKLCFSDEMPEHRWRLHYPRNEDIENTMEIYEMENVNEIINDLKNKISIERRATISTTYMPLTKWINDSEIYRVHTNTLVNGIATIYTKSDIYKNTVVELMIMPKRTFLYQNQDIEELDKLALLEFYVDYSNNAISINLEGFENQEIIFNIRYQTFNNIAYTWYVSLLYPEYSFEYKPKKLIPLISHIPLLPEPENQELEKADIIIQMGIGGCAYEEETRAFILNEDNIVVAYCQSYQNPQYIIDPSYSNKIKISNENTKWLEIENIEENEEYRIIFFNFKGNNHPCLGSQLHVLRKRPSTGVTLDTCIMTNYDAYLTDSSVDNINLIGQLFPSFVDTSENPLIPNIIINHEKIILTQHNGIKEVDLIIDWMNLESEETRKKNKKIIEQNKEIDKENEKIKNMNDEIILENMKHLNNSYFIWQYGREIDANGFVKQHKGYDSPIFANFFHNFRIYSDTFDFSWNPITYYITWDEKGCAFMFCEDPVLGDTVHGFSYFGSLINFKQKLKDDYIGNFGSFGNDLLEADMQGIVVPEFDGELSEYNKDRYNIGVYLRSYFGDFMLQTITPAILTLFDSEFLISVNEVIDVDNIDDLPLTYYMIGAEDLQFEKIKITEEDNFYNYYIIYKDNTYIKPELDSLEIEEYVEIYIDEKKEIILPEIINHDSDSPYIPFFTFTNSNSKVIIELEERSLRIIPTEVWEDTIVNIQSKVKTNKYDIEIDVTIENKNMEIIIWDFAIASYKIISEKIEFSFGAGLQGNLKNRNDFEVNYKIFDNSDNELSFTEENNIIDWNSIEGNPIKIKVEIRQSREEFEHIDIFEIEK